MARLVHEVKRTTLIGICCGVFLCSVGYARVGDIIILSRTWPLCALLFIILCAFLPVRLLVCIALAVLLGVWRGSVYFKQLEHYRGYFGKPVGIVALANEDAVYGKNSQLTFAASKVIIDGHKLKGKIQVSGFGMNAIYRGDTVKIQGKLRKGYGSNQATISYANMTLIARKGSLIDQLRRKFSAGISSSLPEPLASFSMGILIGQRSNLPDGVKQDLKRVGLVHIIAVSGYNLTIIIRAVQASLAKRSKRIAYGSAYALILMFLLITGSSASIVRAAIVSMLSLGAGYFGRSFRPLNLILLAAAITVWQSPFYLWGDLGWYLSFLAFSGIMILSPVLIGRYGRVKHLPVLAVMAIETLSAEVMTLPLILHYFGQMSLAGLPANILVATLVPIAMLLSFIAGLGGLAFASVSGWFSWPALVVLNFMLDTTHIIASLPGVFIENINLDILQMCVLYLIIGATIFLLSNKTKQSVPAKITDKNTRIEVGEIS